MLVLKVGPSTSCSWRLLHAPPQKQVRRPTYKWAGGERMSNRCIFGSASVYTTAARAIQSSRRSACVRYASVCIFVGCVSRVRGSSRLRSAHRLVATGVRHDGAAQPTSVRNCPAGVFDYGIGESMSARAFCLLAARFPTHTRSFFCTSIVRECEATKYSPPPLHVSALSRARALTLAT